MLLKCSCWCCLWIFFFYRIYTQTEDVLLSREPGSRCPWSLWTWRTPGAWRRTPTTWRGQWPGPSRTGATLTSPSCAGNIMLHSLQSSSALYSCSCTRSMLQEWRGPVSPGHARELVTNSAGYVPGEVVEKSNLVWHRQTACVVCWLCDIQKNNKFNCIPWVEPEGSSDTGLVVWHMMMWP